MFKSADQLQLGDVIVEGRTETTVKSIDKTICKNKIHVNGKDCYEPFGDVRVKGGDPELVRQEIEDLRYAVDTKIMLEAGRELYESTL